MNSDIAPSELYLDLKDYSVKDLQDREEEIFDHVGDLLDKKIIYHKSRPSLIKLGGYVELQVDGKKIIYWNYPKLRIKPGKFQVVSTCKRELI